MDFTKIYSISGKSGLHRLVASSKNGIIVETIGSGKRFHAFSSSKISAVEDITVYTINDDVALKDVFKTIAETNNYQAIEIPEKDALFTVFKNYLADFDQERVYTSDVKKVFSWYNLLVAAGDIVKGNDTEEETTEPTTEDTVVKEKKVAPKKTVAKAKGPSAAKPKQDTAESKARITKVAKKKG